MGSGQIGGHVSFIGSVNQVFCVPFGSPSVFEVNSAYVRNSEDCRHIPVRQHFPKRARNGNFGNDCLYGCDEPARDKQNLPPKRTP
jgi:hypothetical protein